MDLKVFMISKEEIYAEWGEKLNRHSWITLVEGKGTLCLPCADLEHLVFLPSGNAALTRRAGKYSTHMVVVLEWSRGS